MTGSDPDPDPACQVITDPDPVQILLVRCIRILKSKKLRIWADPDLDQ